MRVARLPARRQGYRALDGGGDARAGAHLHTRSVQHFGLGRGVGAFRWGGGCCGVGSCGGGGGEGRRLQGRCLGLACQSWSRRRGVCRRKRLESGTRASPAVLRGTPLGGALSLAPKSQPWTRVSSGVLSGGWGGVLVIPCRVGPSVLSVASRCTCCMLAGHGQSLGAWAQRGFHADFVGHLVMLALQVASFGGPGMQRGSSMVGVAPVGIQYGAVAEGRRSPAFTLVWLSPLPRALCGPSDGAVAPRGFFIAASSLDLSCLLSASRGALRSACPPPTRSSCQ